MGLFDRLRSATSAPDSTSNAALPGQETARIAPNPAQADLSLQMKWFKRIRCRHSIRLVRQKIKRPAMLQALRILVPIIGFELMTYRLQGGCSTN